MREIKFRAWDGGEMEYEMDPDYMGHLLCGDNEFDCPLMQYTGLKDKKRTKEFPEGQEIYEGDVIKACHNAVVEMRQGCWWMKPSCGAGFAIGHEDTLKRFEVIGNIYENPELLTK